MFERYTENARRVIFYGRFEAGALGAAAIDTEHVLLGLIRQDQPLVDRLVGAPVDIEAIRRKIAARTDGGETTPTSVDMPLSMAAKRVLALAVDESSHLKHLHIGTEHLFLGLLREEAGVAAEILRELGLSLQKVRDDLAKGASRSASERYDPAADQVIVFAQHEAFTVGSAEVNAEHLLLGLMRQDLELLFRLSGAYIDVESVCPGIRAAAGKSTPPDSAAAGKRVLAHAFDEAQRLNQRQAGTEHLLLGLLLEETSAAAAFLRGMGLSIEKVREDLAKRAAEG
jgi:ATP-dependent Clp protease ATP-binding subunit ClpA